MPDSAAPAVLYKYVPPARIDVLRTLHVRFTQASALNDPFELRPVFEALIPEPELEKALQPSIESVLRVVEEQYPTFDRAIRDRMSLAEVKAYILAHETEILAQAPLIAPSIKAALTQFTPELKGRIGEEMGKLFGIFSMAEEPDNPVLWAHYAANWTGFVIALDTSDPFFNQRRSPQDECFFLRRVNYVDLSPTGRTLSDVDGDNLLVTKQEQWAYEREWRMLAPTQLAHKRIGEEDSQIHLFQIPATAIAGLTVGPQAGWELMAAIQEALVPLRTTREIWLRRAWVNHEQQRITFTDVS